ncbi:MAG TPA: penicillin-binding transpeptidase domain-containing protein [Pyrinomonadaceae bacterium]|nr:penicillin-binding transpeptidase domain-containing protein [Pyrinomonadaceae bacterium]
MSLVNRSPKPVRVAFVLFVLICLSFSSVAFAQKKSKATPKSRKASTQQKGKKVAKKRQTSKRRNVAARRTQNRRTSAATRRQRNQIAKQQAAAIRARQRKLGRPLTKRERAAEMRRVQANYGAAARRRAEAARRAAIARQRARDKAIRDEAQSFIARDITAGEDPEVRRVAVNALGNHAGTVVVMDPMTGRVYTIVNQEWALRRGFKPCSTIKLVTGLAGLCEKVIDPVTFETVSQRYNIDLTDALAYSNNTFFQHVGGQIGFEKVLNYARELGLGERTGLNVPYEFPGRLPSEKSGFALNRMCSHGDDFEVTAIQLATLVSAMANGGKLLTPYIANGARDEAARQAKVRRQIDIEQENWRRMVPGMVGAVNYGSGKKAYDPLQTVAGKTGTCIGQGGWVGLFTSYAPLANPRLAVVVIGKGPDARQHFPAAVAGKIYRELNSRFGTPVNLQIAKTPDAAEDAKAAELNEEDKETAEAEAAEEAAAVEAEDEEVVVPTGNRSTDALTPRRTVKPVIMPVERRNTGTPQAENAKPSVTAPKTVPGNAAQADERPRRVQPMQP